MSLLTPLAHVQSADGPAWWNLALIVGIFLILMYVSRNEDR